MSGKWKPKNSTESNEKKTTLKTSGEDKISKTTLKTSGEDKISKTTLKTSGEDVKNKTALNPKKEKRSNSGTSQEQLYSSSQESNTTVSFLSFSENILNDLFKAPGPHLTCALCFESVRFAKFPLETGGEDVCGGHFNQDVVCWLCCLRLR